MNTQILPRSNEVKKKTNERYVMVTTEHRGVFAGYSSDVSGDVIDLRAARNCVYWSADVKGFLGLAANGPSRDCKIGPPADLQLRKITAVASVTPEAQAKWENHVWSK